MEEGGRSLPVSVPLPYPEVTDKGKGEGARGEMQRAQRGDPGGAVFGREPASSYYTGKQDQRESCC